MIVVLFYFVLVVPLPSLFDTITPILFPLHPMLTLTGILVSYVRVYFVSLDCLYTVFINLHLLNSSSHAQSAMLLLNIMAFFWGLRSFFLLNMTFTRPRDKFCQNKHVSYPPLASLKKRGTVAPVPCDVILLEAKQDHHETSLNSGSTLR